MNWVQKVDEEAPKLGSCECMGASTKTVRFVWIGWVKGVWKRVHGMPSHVYT